MKKYDGHNAEIILLSKTGSLILQHRDDKPDITYPGMIGTFGGGVETGESPLDAAYRELGEETNLKIPKDRFIHYRTYEKTKEVHGENWLVDFFLVREVSTKGLKVYEGQGFVEVSSLEEINKLNTSVLLREIAGDLFDTR